MPRYVHPRTSFGFSILHQDLIPNHSIPSIPRWLFLPTALGKHYGDHRLQWTRDL